MPNKTDLKNMSHLDHLENTSIHIIREAYANFKNLGMLWSIGKDSTVLLWLARKAFFGHAPIPLIHIDTGCKIPEMIRYRDKLTKKWKLTMIYGKNQDAIDKKRTFLGGKVDRLTCCKLLKTKALEDTLSGKGIRYRFNHAKNRYIVDRDKETFTGIIVGVRADEEGSRSKERYFSPRDKKFRWNIFKRKKKMDKGDSPFVAMQDTEFSGWNLFATDFKGANHVRVHPLLHWTELDIWRYIKQENIPCVSLYFAKNGKRYRSIGCECCCNPVCSDADDINKVIEELKTTKILERSGRAQDKESDNMMQKLRALGYM